MKVVSTENAAHYFWGDGADGWHLLQSENLSVIEESVPPNESEQRHYHNYSQQFFYVLSGVAHLEVDGTTFEISAGSGIHVPARTPHQLVNLGTASLRFLVISQPKSHGDRVQA